jgi:bifunctional NMN adenylyltransferase/nudix hydrolase
LQIADRVVVVIGSANEARTLKNPFNTFERTNMIAASLSLDEAQRVDIVSVDDYADDRVWVAAVKGQVYRIVNRRAACHIRIAILGHARDASSFYLSLFPDWSLIALPEYQRISATNVRQHYYASGDIRSVPRAVAEQLRKFQTSTNYQRIADAFCAQSPACSLAGGSHKQ